MFASTRTIGTGAAKEAPASAPPPAGCCRFGIGRPPSTPGRAVLPFFPTSCCGGGAGLADAELPPAVAAAGVSRDAWAGFVSDVSAAQAVSVPGFWTVIAFIPYFWVPVTPFVCCAQARYHARLRAAIDAFNRDVLAPRGLWAALQSGDMREHCCPLVLDAGIGGQSWLVVAVTRADAEALKAEPMYWTGAAPLGCGAGAIVPHPCGDAITSLGWCCTPCVV